ncbi:hypothetical protein D3C87_990350 [compost metagenome]
MSISWELAGIYTVAETALVPFCARVTDCEIIELPTFLYVLYLLVPERTGPLKVERDI